ncbi:nuclear transport factor 2 family protein [Sphingomonas sp. CGMCC 1.13654]|uniref:Nuclear transport factor 2 family protein n=1 Tax=Sphingomonas chungangi TaxID=2683589 RepID=A0A838L4J5_9SPHN|nr:nuclear transport factor 2 family protein [Sphingomonas chungangi]MBA2933615.1 nuclear transport factor 2 family protein [Sphingomonas chungangi]
MRLTAMLAPATVIATCMILAASGKASGAGPSFNAPKDVAAIKALENYIQTETDMDKLAPYYAPDALVLDIYAPGIYKGREQIKAGFAPQLATIRSMKHDMAEMNVATNGRFACAAMQIHFDTVLKSGQALKMSVREIDAFKKIGGKWQIVQQHVSLPVDAKTGMAVVDGPIKAQGPITWSAHPLPTPSTTPEQAKREIRRFMDVGGVSTSLAQLMQYYGPGDDTLVYDTFYPGELRGLKQISGYYAGMMGGIAHSTLTMPEFVADSDGGFGIQADTQDLKLTLKDGSTKRISIRQSDCMRRVGGKWYSFFEMISFPIDMASGKGIMSNPALAR